MPLPLETPFLESFKVDECPFDLLLSILLFDPLESVLPEFLFFFALVSFLDFEADLRFESLLLDLLLSFLEPLERVIRADFFS